ncbi:LysR family transcriptional regulator, partial [Klebsiella pneumoniae]|uniref:LysR family transcriptional regulator n=1 Tax=Klebsiella pneumoniae TaxID=573 RepID=UPI00159EDA83
MRWGYFSLNATGAVAGLVVKRLYVARIGKRKMKRQERIDRIELMRTYIRIVEAGSLSAAAGQMDTTQATVSRRLQSLEGLLGVKLILRTTHAMKLTDDGERCYRHARQVVDAWLALEDDLRIADDRPVGVLRVRAPHAFGQQLLLAKRVGRP